MYKEGQRWVNGKWDVYVRAVEGDMTTLHFPRNGETRTVSSSTVDAYMERYEMHIDPRTIGKTFDDIFSFLVATPYEQRAPLIIRLRKLQKLSDEEFEHVILAQLSGDDGEEVYKALGLEPYAWPLSAPKEKRR